MKWILRSAFCSLFAFGTLASAAPPVEVREGAVPRPSLPPTEVRATSADVQTRVSDFLNTELVLENGDSLGTVSDLVIDNASGKVAYVIVSTDDRNFRGIPWKALALYQGEEPKDRYFILGMEKERFHKAPVIQQKEWSTYTPSYWQGYVPQVNQYYADVKPVRPSAVRRVERTERRIERAVK